MSDQALDTTVSQRSLLRRALDAIVLPGAITSFESTYLRRINRIALYFFYAHLPVFLLIAWANETGLVTTLLLTLACLVPSTVACRTFRSERAKSLVFGFTAMSMGGVLVHIGQGPVQIEMHFYFFSVLAMLAMFANPMVILVAALTVSLHHLALWFLVPASVFNYDAPLWVVLVHALFVVLETVAACFIARNFFDNVIGLEKKVEQRTAEIRARNRDMRLVLDTVRQGLVTIDAEGRMSAEHSNALEQWFGEYTAGERFADYVGRSCQRFGTWFALGWESVVDGFLPLEVTIEQLPKQAQVGERHYAFTYEAIVGEHGQIEKALVVVSDVTAEVASAEAEALQRETLAIFERVLNDRSGFLEFYDEATRLLEQAEALRGDDWSTTKRHIHTLKGNAGVFGIDSVARLCHTIEDSLAEDGRNGAVEHFTALRARWDGLSQTVERLLGKDAQDSVVLSGEEHERILRLVVEGADRTEIARALIDATLEPTEVRLSRFADQARALAERLAKGLEVEVDGNGLRLERERFAPFWSSFTHVLRNAIDHGIEAPDQRAATGKPTQGQVQLRTFTVADEFVLEVRDDGRGIDWSRVREKAKDLGIECDGDAGLLDALFAPGLSTKDEASEISGRGVGLAAVRESCNQLGGRIEIESEKGRGSVFRFRFPRTACADYPQLVSNTAD